MKSLVLRWENTSYQKSLLWKIIKEEVLARDSNTCIALGCSNPARSVIPINQPLQVLIGIAPFCLVSLCEDCVAKAAKSGGPWLLVVGVAKTPGKSQPAIGAWYDKQRAKSRRTARRIYNRLLREAPDWAKQIRQRITSGEFPDFYVDYLGLKRYTTK